MPAGQTQSLFSALLPFVILLVVFYFMLIRPQQAQKKKREQMLAGLRKGNRIITIGGIHGEILDIKDDVMTVNISDQPDKVVVRFSRWAVQEVLGKENQPS
ncbi:MAG: preprotein translocase subunit YajC [Firmicutes bacterium]|jgi:preprotein translocase subunit YajC|nr:preprotein translocase subunit YajC [Bacillota bacterium]